MNKQKTIKALNKAIKLLEDDLYSLSEEITRLRIERNNLLNDKETIWI